MVYGVILGILFGVGCLAMAAIAIWGAIDEGTVKKCVGGILCPILFVLFLCIPFSFHQIETGEIAVVRHMGKATDIRTAGTHFDFWMTESYDKYDTKVQTISTTAQAYSKDKQMLDMQMDVYFTINQDKDSVIGLRSDYGNLDALANKIQSIALEQAKGVVAGMDSDKIIAERNTLSDMVEDKIQEAVKSGYYCTITNVALTNIDFSDSFEAAAEAANVAKQELAKAEVDKQIAIVQAQKELESAKLQADAKLYAAEQDAEAKKAIALAEAVATSSKIAKLAESLGYKVETEYTLESRTKEVPVYVDTEKQEQKKDTAGNLVYETVADINHDREDGLWVTNKIAGYKITWVKKDADGNEVYDPEGQKTVLEYLQYLEYLAKWNGELPEVITGSDGSIMIPMPGSNN